MVRMKSKISTFLISLAAAFLLWLYVISVVSPGSTETYYNIPVVLQGQGALEGRNLVIMKGGSTTVDLELSGNRTDLMELNSYNITITADLSKIYDAGEHSLPFNIFYPGSIARNAIEERSRSADTLDIYVEWIVEKEIPIKINWSGAVPATHIAYREERELSHEKITVRGPSSIVEKIARAEINVDLEGKTEPVTQTHRFILTDENGTEISSDLLQTSSGGTKLSQIDITVMILQKLEIPLNLEIIDGGGATQETASIQILTTGADPREITSVTVAGLASALELIDREEPIITIDLAEYPEDQDVLVPLTFLTTANVTNVSQITEVLVEIRFPELQVREFKLDKITPINIPEGMAATVETQELTVQVRGPKELVEQMDEKDFTVTVDLTGELQGSFTKVPAITIAEEFAQVGILGDFSSVSVKLDPSVEAIGNDTDG